MRFLMETVVNVTEQSNLPVQYGSEMPGIWLINWNITMHLNNPATRRRTYFWGFNARPSPVWAAKQLAPHEERAYSFD